MDSILGIWRVLCSSIRRSPNYSHKGRGWLSQWNVTGREQLQRLELPWAEWKATLERVWMSQWLWTSSSAFCYPRRVGGGAWRSSPPTRPAVMIFLDSTQAHFDFWQWHCVSVSPSKEHITIMMAPIVSNFSPRKEIAKGWWLMGYSVSGCPTFMAFSDCLCM